MSTKSRAGERAAHRATVNQALDLYAEGRSLRTIAAEMKVTIGRAQRLVSEGISSLPEQDIVELRTASELRMDRAAEVAADLLTHSDPRVCLQAARDLSAIEANRSRLLGTWQKPVAEGDLPLPAGA